MKEKTKSIIEAIIMTLALIFIMFFIIYTISQIGIQRSVEDNKVCEDIGMDTLSISRQVFGDDYVICYNKLNNETREILI